MKENYLIHAGVKGMKWGVRKKVEPVGDNRSSSQKSNTESSNQTPKQKSKGKTVAKVLGITAGATALAGLVTAGAIIAAKAIKNKGNTRVADILDRNGSVINRTKINFTEVNRVKLNRN